MTDPKQILARLQPSAARRFMAVILLSALAFFLIFLGTQHPSPIGALFLIGLGSGAVWVAVFLWQRTKNGILLRADGLYLDTGERLVALSDIEMIDRGALAIRPSGGFTLRLSQPQKASWAPGLWWRLGRRFGVGGVTHRHYGTQMAEAIAGLLAARRH